MIEPFLKDDAFQEDVRRLAGDPGRLHLWWLGQSGFLVGWGGHFLLLDPYLSDSLTRKYANSERPHVRMTARVIAPERLDFIEAVTSSHNHSDHLDGETLIPLLAANPGLKIIVGRANLAFAAARLQMPIGRLTPIRAGGDPVDAGPFILWAIPSAHEALATDENGDQRFLGFIVQVGRWTIYHSGDACPYPGLEENLSRWKLDVAILPINGRDPRRGVAGNFSAREAAALGKATGAGLVIPCHYDMFAFNTVSPQEFIAAAQVLGQPYHLLRNGERLSLG